MAFTGAATVTVVADNMVRITGLSLASAAVGTIGLSTASGTPGVTLPAQFAPSANAYGGPGGAVSLQDSMEVDIASAAIGVATAIPVSVVKSGTTPIDFLISLTNTHGSLATSNLEIYVKFHT